MRTIAALKTQENLEFEEAARLCDEVKRLEAVGLAVADDPMARQYAVEDSAKASGRSTLGRGCMRGDTRRKRKGR